MHRDAASHRVNDMFFSGAITMNDITILRQQTDIVQIDGGLASRFASVSTGVYRPSVRVE